MLILPFAFAFIFLGLVPARDAVESWRADHWLWYISRIPDLQQHGVMLPATWELQLGFVVFGSAYVICAVLTIFIFASILDSFPVPFCPFVAVTLFLNLDSGLPYHESSVQMRLSSGASCTLP